MASTLIRLAIIDAVCASVVVPRLRGQMRRRHRIQCKHRASGVNHLYRDSVRPPIALRNRAASIDDANGLGVRMLDAAALAEAVDALPARLVVWHDGPATLSRLLASCTFHRLLGEAELLSGGVAVGLQRGEVEDPRRTDHRDRWRHAVSTIIEWHGRHGLPSETLVPPPDRAPRARNRAAARRARKERPRRVAASDYETAVALARLWYELDPLRIGLRAGDLEVFRRDTRHVWVRNRRRADIEALDILLGYVTVLDSASSGGALSGSSDRITEWFESNSPRAPRGGGVQARHPYAFWLINSVPSDLRDQAWTDIEDDLVRQGQTVADELDLGGLSFANARTCYAFLISQLRLNMLGAFHFGTPEATLWGIRPSNLKHALATRVGPGSANAFVQMCTSSPGRSPVSAPLIPNGDVLLIPAEIVSPIAFERTLLRAASADPAAAGNLGNVLGNRAARWAERLRAIPNCLVGEGVQVKDAHGRSMGDLDVVAWDPRARTMAIFETKWPVDAATLTESIKVDAVFDKGRAQLTRLRAAIEVGSATVIWPRSWNVADDRVVFWWVGSAQQLDSRPPPPDDGIGSTSLRMVEQLLPADGLDDLMSRLANFPLPRVGVEYELQPCHVRAGDLTIHYDGLAMLGRPPLPPAERRTHLGWT